MGLSFGHILLVIVLFLLLFGRGKLPALMGDIAEGIKSFRKGIQDDRQAPADVRVSDVKSNQTHLNAEGSKYNDV